MDGKALDPIHDGMDGVQVATTPFPAAYVIARPEVNGQLLPSSPIQDQTQERNGHLVEQVNVLPEAWAFNGDPPPRATDGRDFGPVPPFRVSP